MAIESLEKRRRKLSEIRDSAGNPLDVNQLAHEQFLTRADAGPATIRKSRMTPDRSGDREVLAKACEQMAELMADFRPSLSKASARNANRTRQMELLDAARKLRAKR
jgi:hypothetical protein